MRDWLDAGQKWRCAHCVEPLRFTELWQDAVTGDLFCSVCWMSLMPGLQPVLPPVLCDECGASCSPRPALDAGWSGVGDWPLLCDICAEPPTEDEEAEFIGGLLKLLEETGEEG